jgi:serine/threonine protein kinase
MERILLGSGAYGAVFSPPFPSSSGEIFENDDVGKVFFEDSDEDEWNIIYKLRKIENKKQKYFIYPYRRCLIDYPSDESNDSMVLKRMLELKNPEKPKQLEQFIMKNAGISLKEYINKKYSKYHMYRKVYYSQNNVSRKTLVKLLENVFYGIKRLVDFGYVHQDIKESNITVLKNERAMLIDFGLTVSFEDYYNPNTNFLLRNTYHTVSPPEIYLFQLYNLSDITFEKVCEFTDVEPSVAGNKKKFDKFLNELQNINEPFLNKVKDLVPEEQIPQFLESMKSGNFSKMEINIKKELEPYKQQMLSQKMEYYRSHNFAEKCDIYSLGMTIERLYSHLIRGESPEITNNFRKLFRGMIDINPITRIDIYKAIELIEIIKNL